MTLQKHCSLISREQKLKSHLKLKLQEEQELQVFVEQVKQQHPEPFPKPLFAGGSEDDYKNYMRARLQYEEWENKVLLLAREAHKKHNLQLQLQQDQEIESSAPISTPVLTIKNSHVSLSLSTPTGSPTSSPLGSSPVTPLTPRQPPLLAGPFYLKKVPSASEII